MPDALQPNAPCDDVHAKALEGLWLFPFIAPPNGGKGTQTQRLARDLQLPKLDTGAELRKMAAEDTPLGHSIRERLNQGLLVDTPVVMRVLEAAIFRLMASGSQHQQGGMYNVPCVAPPPCRAMILDGFPRNREQVEGLGRLCEQTGMRIGKAIYLKVPHEVIYQRANNRRLCPACHAIYNLQTTPPRVSGVCDVDGAALIQRPDDQLETVKTRLALFEDETRPMIAWFRERGYLLKIDGNRPPDDITEELEAALTGFLSGSPAPTTTARLAKPARGPSSL
jgi:adenylate kinase